MTVSNLLDPEPEDENSIEHLHRVSTNTEGRMGCSCDRWRLTGKFCDHMIAVKYVAAGGTHLEWAGECRNCTVNHSAHTT